MTEFKDKAVENEFAFAGAASIIKEATSEITSIIDKLREGDITQTGFVDERTIIITTLHKLLTVKDRDLFNAAYPSKAYFLSAMADYHMLIMTAYQKPLRKLAFTFFDGDVEKLTAYYWELSGKIERDMVTPKPEVIPKVETKPKPYTPPPKPKAKQYVPPPRPVNKAKPCTPPEPKTTPTKSTTDDGASMRKAMKWTGILVTFAAAIVVADNYVTHWINFIGYVFVISVLLGCFGLYIFSMVTMTPAQRRAYHARKEEEERIADKRRRQEKEDDKCRRDKIDREILTESIFGRDQEKIRDLEDKKWR